MDKKLKRSAGGDAHGTRRTGAAGALRRTTLCRCEVSHDSAAMAWSRNARVKGHDLSNTLALGEPLLCKLIEHTAHYCGLYLPKAIRAVFKHFSQHLTITAL
ncbi:hypothetical protein EVAR_18294_1 [Eumeta japonica]|uniref:Uncharacterized protein n=1 Tax=Eumeta variegata TaxID=151549 RepID=A0A4C1V903_EUMVA|nr:hypothetical protein EVAR_18294_1 [Eumeta japonica]